MVAMSSKSEIQASTARVSSPLNGRVESSTSRKFIEKRGEFTAKLGTEAESLLLDATVPARALFSFFCFCVLLRTDQNSSSSPLELFSSLSSSFSCRSSISSSLESSSYASSSRFPARKFRKMCSMRSLLSCCKPKMLQIMARSLFDKFCAT